MSDLNKMIFIKEDDDYFEEFSQESNFKLLI